MKRCPKRVALTVLGLLLSFAILIVPANCQAPDVAKVASVEGITEYGLPNGLQILLFPDHSQTTITVNITYHVGSRHEGRGESGMAHLLEHMVFKGTPTYPSIWGALENHGANFNGTTWVDRTNYFETLPANPENLEFAIDMEADRMINSYIDGEELAKEMTVVRNEFERGENSPTSVLSERMMSSAFLWHNYGKSTIGNRSDIERVPVENLRKFYKRYYQPDNATLLVAGNFDTNEVLNLIQKKFGPIPRPDRVLDPTYTEEPAQDGPRHAELTRVGDVAAAGLIYHIPAGPHPDFAAIQILEDTFTSQPSGRLYRQLVVPGQATSVSGVAFGWAEPGVMEFSAQVASDHDPQTVLDFMTEIVESAADDGITEKAVQRSKTRALKSIKLSMTNSGRIGVRLSETIAQGDWRLFFLHRDRLAEVTVEDVQRVAKKYLIASNRTSGLFLPTDAPTRVAIPTAPEVAKLVDDYKGGETISEGEGFRPDTAFIEERTIRETLPSGIKVAFLPMEKRGDAVWLSARVHYGTEAALVDKTTEAALMPMLMNRGTKNKTYQELQDAIDALESRISLGGFRGGGSNDGVIPASIQSDREHIVPAIALLAEMFQKPAFDPGEYKVIQERLISMMEQGKSNPQVLGMTEMRRKLRPWPKDSIHYVPTLDETISLFENASLETVKQIHNDYVGGSHMEIAVIGDFEVDDVRKVIEQHFGGWKSPSTYQRIEQPYIAPEIAEIRIETPDKEMAVVGMGTAMPIMDTDPNYPALVMANYVLGGNPKSRLMNRLRHQGGLSYGANSSFHAGSRDDRGSFSSNAICAPQNAQQAIDAMRDEVKQWLEQGLTAQELATAQKSYALKFQSSLGSERYLLRQLVSGLELNRTLQFQADLQEKIKALTLQQIEAALEKVFGDVGMVEIMAGDLARDDEESDIQTSEDEKRDKVSRRVPRRRPSGAGAQ
jgi:zinc protease